MKCTKNKLGDSKLELGGRGGYSLFEHRAGDGYRSIMAFPIGFSLSNLSLWWRTGADMWEAYEGGEYQDFQDLRH